MTFKKGNKLGKGRPKGSKDQKTQDWHNIGEYLITKGAARYVEELQAAEGKEFMERFEKILEYFKPKLARTELSNEEGKDFVIKLTNYAGSSQVHSSGLPASSDGRD